MCVHHLRRCVEAKAHGLRPVFNFGVIGEWARPPRSDFPPGEAGDRQWQNALADPALPGQFLADFIAFAAREKDGFATLENVAGWQMFNEVNTAYGDQPGQMPRDDYLTMGEQTLALVHAAYAAVGWASKSKSPPPPVIMPSLAERT